MKYNIFQGNDSIRLQICKSLDLDSSDKFSFTNPIYYTTFFYLQQRFGDHFKVDDHKDAAVWDFKVKYYIIRVELLSTNVNFLIFGPKENVPKYPLWAKMDRMSKNGSVLNPLALFLDKQKTAAAFKGYLLGKGIKHSEAKQGHLDDFCKLLKTDHEAITKDLKGKYKDEDYSNAYTRHALRTLDQFLKNMLTPIYIRDVGYNIKGRCEWCDRYKNNIKIEKVDK